MKKTIVRWITWAPKIFLVALFGFGCAHKAYLSPGNSSDAVTEMLDQINESINVARSHCQDPPDITSVQVDLQTGTSGGATGSIGLGLIFPTAQVSMDNTNKISLTFVPRPVDESVTQGRSNQALTSAIETVFMSVASANSHYQFQTGSFVVQCTLESGVGLGNNSDGKGTGSGQGSSSSPSVKLVPLQLGISSSKQSVQTITLNFSPKTALPAKVQAPAPMSKEPAETPPQVTPPVVPAAPAEPSAEPVEATTPLASKF